MIKGFLNKILVFSAVFFIALFQASAQYASEEELKDAANQLFEDENYSEALPLFSQLLSLYPKDPNYNFKYGASSLYAKKDKEKPLKYLKFAVTKSNVDPLAYYFLARGYHINYNFEAAIVNYNKFKEKGNSKQFQKYDVYRQIEMCESGKTLLKSLTEIGVVDNKEIRESDFFRSYTLDGIGGKVVVKPDEFKSKVDKKKGDNSLIYIGEKKDQIIYSSYGDDSKGSKDLYKVTKTPSGEWSKPQKLNGVNSNYDEEYPFLHSDGKTLFFSSKGFNSMGGYDIFRSTFNSSTNSWSTPENLDFPINTPGNDILYISDVDNKLAYFASNRNSEQGKINVFKVTVNPMPVKNSVIKGVFLAEVNPTMRDAKITIQDVDGQELFGVYKTDNKTGKYLLLLPSNGGKFKILVETNDSAPIHSAIIDVPALEEFRSLKQELVLVGEGGK